MRRTAVVTAGLVLALAPAAGAGPREGWEWPLGDGDAPVVTRAFDPPATRYGAGHRGVDLAGSAGAAVRAVRAGTVSFAGVLAGRGVLVVSHGALRSTYEPVTASVPVGAAVAAGEVIGTLADGHAGCRAAACLHWGVRRGDDYLDPLALLAPAELTLLPLVGARAPDAAGVPAPAVRRPAEPSPATSGPGPGDAPADPAMTPVSGRSVTGGLLAAVLLALVALRPWRPRPPSGTPGAAAGHAPMPAAAPAAPVLELPARSPPSALDARREAA